MVVNKNETQERSQHNKKGRYSLYIFLQQNVDWVEQSCCLLSASYQIV